MAGGVKGVEKTVGPAQANDPASILSKTLTSEDLSHIQLFEGEDSAALVWVLASSQERWLQSGDVLLTPGEKNDYLYLIVEGRVQIQLSKDETISFVGRGDCLGELSVLDGKPVGAYVIADEPCRLLAVPHDTLWELIDTHHAVAKNILRLMSGRIRSNNETLNASISLQRRYEQSVRVDALTGLYNRRWLDEMLPRYVERAHQGGQPLGLMMLDIDNFKQYNDTHGHQAGDQALRMSAHTILEHIRPDDAGVRYGGEEFVVIISELDLAQVAAVAARICRHIAGQAIVALDGCPLPGVTISIGVSSLQCRQDGEGLIAVADKALYRAKEHGRNRVEAL